MSHRACLIVWMSHRDVTQGVLDIYIYIDPNSIILIYMDLGSKFYYFSRVSQDLGSKFYYFRVFWGRRPLRGRRPLGERKH